MPHRSRNRWHTLVFIWAPLIYILGATGAASQEVGSQKPVSPAAEGPRVLNVRDFGATGDGKSLDTAAIRKAVKLAAAKGGGTVLFPPGTYVTGTFELLSNVTLDLEAGAVIEGSKNLADYDSIYNPHASSCAGFAKCHRNDPTDCPTLFTCVACVTRFA